ncbi:hypothetical protein [Kocuria flava]|uniref:hypothetical protein n=1 Tax=Kocuria flava TaxID=446860 RepID=UPI002F95DCBC
MPSLISRVTPSALLWFGVGCLLTTVVAVAVAFLGGNAAGGQTAGMFLVGGLVGATVAASVTIVVALAGLIGFPRARPRFAVLLLLAVVCHPLLWIGLLATVL